MLMYFGLPRWLSGKKKKKKKNPPTNAGDLALIPGWKDSQEKEMATYSSVLAWNIL